RRNQTGGAGTDEVDPAAPVRFGSEPPRWQRAGRLAGDSGPAFADARHRAQRLWVAASAGQIFAADAGGLADQTRHATEASRCNTTGIVAAGSVVPGCPN